MTTGRRKDVETLLGRHDQLNHIDDCRVTSHVQRASGDWLVNTLMIEGYDVPFRYQRKKRYRSLEGARVNLTYYADAMTVAGLRVEVMNVVRIRRS